MSIRYLSVSAVIAVSAVGAAQGQSNSTYVANDPYSSDYEVGSWSASDRERQPDYLQQQYMASDELLGGPVAQPGERDYRFGRRGGLANVSASTDAITIVETDALAQRNRAVVDEPKTLTAGMPVRTPDGDLIGSVAIVHHTDDGEVRSAWVRSAQSTSNLIEIPLQNLEFEAGYAIAG